MDGAARAPNPVGALTLTPLRAAPLRRAPLPRAKPAAPATRDPRHS